MGCNHITEIWSIYDGGVTVFQADGEFKDLEYKGYTCKFCPRCGEKLPEPKEKKGE